MNMKKLMPSLVFLSTIFTHTSAMAETVVLRSGEHQDFSRLVIQFSDEIPTWALGRSASGYTLQLDQEDLTIDTSETYQRIGRSRLSDLHFDEETPSLSLDVDCECHVDAFNFRDNKLVVDIKSGHAPETSPFEAPLNQLSNSQESTADLRAADPSSRPNNPLLNANIERSDTSLNTPAADVVLHLPRATNRHPILQNLPPLEILADQNETTSSRLASSPNTHNSTPMPQENPSRRRETEDILLRELERAASQGLLSAVLPDIPDQRPTQPVDVMPARPRPNEPDIGDMQITGHFNIEADTSIDRDMITSALGVATGNTGSSCRLGTLLDIRTWGDPDNPAAAITENRAELLDGRDQIDPASIISLAQAYLYASFGAEASQILALSVNDSPQTRALRQIADLSDGSNVRTNGPLSELQNCPNTGAFWALLTENAIPAQGVNHDAVIEVVTSLPPHLRSIFGSRIMRLYISAGDTSRAQIIRDAIARTPQGARPNFRIAEAEMSHSAGEHEAAEVALTDVIGENSLQSLDALVIFLQTALEQKKSIEPTILENAEALAFEHRNNETGVRLKFLLARSYSQARDFERAANAFETLDGIASAHDLRFAWREFSQEIFNLEADADFVTKVYQHKNNLQNNSLDTHLQHKIAGRLIDLGFSDAGQGFLETPSLNHTADVRLLLARAAYLVEDYDRALQLAAQLEAPQASELRQGIHQRLREYGTAIQELETRDSSASTLDLTWRGGDWDALASDDLDLPQTRAAQIMIDIGQTSDIDAAPPSLSTSAEALQRSQSDRAILDELLNDVFPSMETASPDVSG